MLPVPVPVYEDIKKVGMPDFVVGRTICSLSPLESCLTLVPILVKSTRLPGTDARSCEKSCKTINALIHILAIIDLQRRVLWSSTTPTGIHHSHVDFREPPVSLVLLPIHTSLPDSTMTDTNVRFTIFPRNSATANMPTVLACKPQV